MANERIIEGIHRAPGFHMVGDGFKVMGYISPGGALSKKISPFLLLDYHPPHDYPPTDSERRGVGPHPHRGFETVTLAFAGSVAHHDSAGNGGVIGPGDVQWMTAGSGLLHREYHEKNYARRGGPMHMMQIWVNLPKAHKMHPPRYQELAAAQMGKVKLPKNAGEVRVIAGAYQGVQGPAKTFTPINMFDIRLDPAGRAEFSFPEKENAALMVMSGEVKINGKAARGLDFVLFENQGESIAVEAATEAQLVLLNGEPINEPIVSYGPFVMNTEEEIYEAVADFRKGKYGALED